MKKWGGARQGAGRKPGLAWDFEKAKELQEKGVSLKEIAYLLGVSYAVIWENFKKAGLTHIRQLKPLEDCNWDHVLEYGVVAIREDARSTRRYVTYAGRNFPYARVVWNANHPEDIADYLDEVHHKDQDTLNDDIGNLKKMTKKEHKQLHKHLNMIS